MITECQVLARLVEWYLWNYILFLHFLSWALISEHLIEFIVGGGIGGFRRHCSFYIKIIFYLKNLFVLFINLIFTNSFISFNFLEFYHTLFFQIILYNLIHIIFLLMGLRHILWKNFKVALSFWKKTKSRYFLINVSILKIPHAVGKKSRVAVKLKETNFGSRSIQKNHLQLN